MDERTWRLALATLAAGVLVPIIDALSTSFDTPAGFFPFLGLVMGFLGAVAAVKGKNGKADDDDA